MSKKGIDVSKYQGFINWKKAKTDGVNFAVLKCINKSNEIEPSFERNYLECVALSIPIGVYNYSYANTVAKARKDAQAVIKALNGKKIDLKVWMDVEDAVMKNLGSYLIDIINAYKYEIESAGYEFGVYTGLSFYNTYIIKYGLIKAPFWIARYPSILKMTLFDDPNPTKKPSIKNDLFAWQYSSKGAVDGVSGNVDLNVMYEIDHAMNPYPVPKRTLRKGSKGEDVKWLQWEINEAGLYLDIDGDFGAKTEYAVLKFQSSQKIGVDGIVGKETRTCLMTV